MANPNNPFGARPMIRMGGSPFSVTEYQHLATDSVAIYLFDIVGSVAGSAVLPENSSYYARQVSSCYTNSGGMTIGTSLWNGAALAYVPVSTLGIVPVTDEVDVIYLMQGKTGTTYSTATHVGKRANISVTTAGSTTTHMSGIAVDGGTIAATATLDLGLWAISRISPNVEGANAIFEVWINKHIYGQQTAGV